MTDVMNPIAINGFSESNPLLDHQSNPVVSGKRKVENIADQEENPEYATESTNKRSRIENDQLSASEAQPEQQAQQFNGEYYVRFGNEEFKDYQMVLRTTKGDSLKTIFQANSTDLLEKVVFRFEPAGFVVIGMDPLGGYLVHSKINASAIENYYCPVIFHMKLHLGKLAYRLGLLESKGNQILTLKARQGVLDISIESGSHTLDESNSNSDASNGIIVPSETAATFTLTELDREYELPLPEAKLVRSIDVDIAWFAKAIKNLENIDTSGSERIKFTITCSSLSLSIDNNGISEGQIVCRQSNATTSAGTGAIDTARSYCYNLKWLNICIKVFKQIKTPLNLSFGEEGQLFFAQDLAGDMGSNRILIGPLASVEE